MHLQQHSQLVIPVRHELLPAAQASNDIPQRAQTHVDALGLLQPVASRTCFASSFTSRQINQGELSYAGNASGGVLCLD